MSTAFAATHSSPIDSDVGAVAVAAAAVVTWLLGDEHGIDSSYAQDAVAWARRGDVAPSVQLIRDARRALQRVRAEDSELAGLWREAGDAEWRAQLDRLDGVLSSAAS